ncbi:MAG: methyltransferase domain-containing protein [Ilumatobacteraceae bacterium]
MVEPYPFESTVAAYDASADVYAAAIGTEVSPAIEGPLDRALLDAFVELVSPPDGRLIADIGCGPGRVASFLAARGLQVIGVDPSRGMLAAATAAHPGLRFENGSLDSLPVADNALAGAVCWYSIIHTPPAHLPKAFAELARVLARDGQLLLAFQAGGGEALHRTSVAGRPVSLTTALAFTCTHGPSAMPPGCTNRARRPSCSPNASPPPTSSARDGRLQMRASAPTSRAC